MSLEDELITAAASRRPPVRALHFRRSWKTFSEPALLRCEGGDYVVKAYSCAGRAIVNEQIAARLGMFIGAPVPPIGLVNVPRELIAATPALGRMSAGVAHGARFVPGCIDQEGIEPQYVDEPENRRRFAALLVLYSWVGVWMDHRLIYRASPPHLAYSVDHGHMFPGEGRAFCWTPQSLRRAGPARLDPWFAPCGLRDAEVAVALDRLADVGTGEIVQAAAGPPPAWDIELGERVAMVENLQRRQADLLRLGAAGLQRQLSQVE